MPVRSLFGIQGLLTAHFGLSLFVGYGASFYEDGDDFDHVIALDEGDSTIRVVARDSFGNEARWDVRVEVVLEEQSSEGDGFTFSESMIILVAAFVALLVLVIMSRRWFKSSRN